MGVRNTRPAVGQILRTLLTGRSTRRLTRLWAAFGLRHLLVLVGVVSFLVRLPFMVGPVYARLVADWGVYWVVEQDILASFGFYHATELRTPGYPLILAGLSYFPGSLDHSVVVAQHLAGIAVTVGVVWAAWRYFGRFAAVLTGIIGATSPVLVDLEGNMMPDFLVGAFAVVGALVLARALEDEDRAPRLGLLAGAGVLFGCSALVKPVAQALILTALVPLLVDPRKPTRALRGGALLAGCFVLTISPWLVRNAVTFGNVRMSNQDGFGLWFRMFDWDKRPIPVDTAEGKLVKRIYDATVIKHGDARPSYTNEYVAEALQSPPYNYTEQQATAIMRRESLRAIFAAPRVYAQNTWTNLRYLSRSWYDLFLARYAIDAKIRTVHPTLSTTFSSYTFRMAKRVEGWWQFFTLAYVAVVFLLFTRSRRQRVGVLALGMTWLAIEGATAATAYPDARYASEMEPVLWVLGSTAAALVLRGLANQIRAAMGRYGVGAPTGSDPHGPDLERAEA